MLLIDPSGAIVNIAEVVMVDITWSPIDSVDELLCRCKRLLEVVQIHGIATLLRIRMY